MHSGKVLLVVVAGGGVRATLARPGETPTPNMTHSAGPCGSHDQLDAFLRRTLGEAGLPALIGAAVAVEGGEPENGAIVLEGQAWAVDLKRLRAVLGTPRVYLHNALVACALAAPGLAADCREVLCEGVARPDAPMVVVGPETVVATAFVVPDAAGGWTPCLSQGALIGPLPLGPREIRIAEMLQAEGWTMLDEILSSRGLVQIHGVVRRLDGLEPDGANDDPLAVAALATAGDARAREATAVYSGWLGSLSRVLALATSARGGVFVSSPFVRALGPAFDRGAFAARFRRADAPGAAYLAPTPAYHVTVSMAVGGLATLFSPSDARFAGRTAVHLLDC